MTATDGLGKEVAATLTKTHANTLAEGLGHDVALEDGVGATPGDSDTSQNVTVLVDVAGLDRVFDYVLPPGLQFVPEGGPPGSPKPRDGVRGVAVGSVLRVPLGPRRVRGWVLGGGAPSTTAKLKTIAGLTGVGPSADMVELATWAAWRWAGLRYSFLRAATAERVVSRVPVTVTRVNARVAPQDALSERAFALPASVVRIPPAGDRLPLALAAAARGQSLLLCPGPTEAQALAARLARAGISVARLPQEWSLAAAGATVVGSRAAVWVPAPNLAAVVVFDEHDDRYQSQRAPTWHAREVAIERARRCGVPVVLVSPAPSLEALAVAPLLTVSRAQERSGWPHVEIVDLTTVEDPLRTGFYTPALVRLLRGDGRILVVVNRVGRSRLLACVLCTHLVTCEACGAALAQKERGGDFHCPRCHLVQPPVCLHCGASRFKLLRPGADRIAEEIAALVSEDVDVVTAASPENLGRTRVVVGTDAALHRSGAFRAVALLDVDGELTRPNFRAGDQTFALIIRAARAVGGRDHGGRIVIQTRLASHPVLLAAARSNPALHSDAELQRRRVLNLPPVTALARLSGAGAQALAAVLEHDPDLSVQGPVGGAFLVRGPSTSVLANALARTPRAAGTARVEVGPLDV